MGGAEPSGSEAAPSSRKARLSACLKYLVAVVLVGGIIGVVCALVSPRTKGVNIAVGVEAASLSRFSLSSNSSLEYALALNLTLSNNGHGFSVHYNKLQARALYGGEEFANAALPSFSQPSNSNSTVGARYRGQTRMTGGQAAEKLDRERGEGYYYIDLRVDLDLWTQRYYPRKAVIKSVQYYAKAACSLKLPLASVNGSVAGRFERTRCDLKFS